MSVGGEEASSSLLGDGEAVAAKSIPVSVSFLHSALCGDCDIVACRVVSEEGQAPPVSQEALRPQPADGLRQSPRLPREPLRVSVVEAATGGGLTAGDGGLLPDARFGGGHARCESYLVFGHSSTGCPSQRVSVPPRSSPTVTPSPQGGTGSVPIQSPSRAGDQGCQLQQHRRERPILRSSKGEQDGGLVRDGSGARVPVGRIEDGRSEGAVDQMGRLASTFVPLSEFDESVVEDAGCSLGDQDPAGHQIGTSGVVGLFDTAVDTGGGGRRSGRGWGGRRGRGGTRGRGRS
ncbi:hypothetical protein Dimus_036768 [Dionaea muscipula]